MTLDELSVLVQQVQTLSEKCKHNVANGLPNGDDYAAYRLAKMDLAKALGIYGYRTDGLLRMANLQDIVRRLAESDPWGPLQQMGRRSIAEPFGTQGEFRQCKSCKDDWYVKTQEADKAHRSDCVWLAAKKAVGE